MQEVFEKTRELGEAILRSDEYATMHAAEEKALQNAEAAELMNQYGEHRQKLEALMSETDPDAAAMKALSDKLDTLQERLQAMEDIAAMNEARGAFSNLVNQINQVLKFIITGEIDGEEEGGCGGSCEGCSGGCHTLH